MYLKKITLEKLHLSDLKTDKFMIEFLLLKLDENPKIKVLKLQKLYLDTANSSKYIST